MRADTEVQLSRFKSLLPCLPAENDNIHMNVMRIRWGIVYNCRVPMVGYYYFWKQAFGFKSYNLRLGKLCYIYGLN